MCLRILKRIIPIIDESSIEEQWMNVDAIIQNKMPVLAKINSNVHYGNVIMKYEVCKSYR